jgi:predicted transcriptional regulator
MNSKKITVIIKSGKQLKSEVIQALQGKKKYIQAKNHIVFNSVKSFTRILTRNRLEILIHLNHHNPKSIYELAKELKRDFKNVHGDVRKLAHLGLIKLEKSHEQRGRLIPRAKYSGLQLSLISA